MAVVMEMGKLNKSIFVFQFNNYKIYKTASLPKPSDNFVELTSAFAVSTGTIGADLQQIPNEPIVFKVKIIYFLIV
jgi:hypothetical protein